MWLKLRLERNLFTKILLKTYYFLNQDSYQVHDYNNHLKHPLSNNSLLVDVRPKEQFDIASLPNSINIPWGSGFLKRELIDDLLPPGITKDSKTYVICRFGNDSQIATKTMMEKFGFTDVMDIKGGVTKWSEQIDKKFPKY